MERKNPRQHSDGQIVLVTNAKKMTSIAILLFTNFQGAERPPTARVEWTEHPYKYEQIEVAWDAISYPSEKREKRTR